MKPRSVLLVSTGAAGMHAKWRWVTVTGGTASARPTCAFGIRCAPALIWLGGLPTRLRKTRRWKFLAALNTRAAAGRCALPGANGCATGDRTSAPLFLLNLSSRDWRSEERRVGKESRVERRSAQEG